MNSMAPSFHWRGSGSTPRPQSCGLDIQFAALLGNFRLFLGNCRNAIEPLSDSISYLELILQFYAVVLARIVIFVFDPRLRRL